MFLAVALYNSIAPKGSEILRGGGLLPYLVVRTRALALLRWQRGTLPRAAVSQLHRANSSMCLHVCLYARVPARVPACPCAFRHKLARAPLAVAQGQPMSNLVHNQSVMQRMRFVVVEHKKSS